MDTLGFHSVICRRFYNQMYLGCLGRGAHLTGAVSFLMTSCVVSILCLLFTTWNDVTSVKSYPLGSLLDIITNIGEKSVLVICWARSSGLPETLPRVLPVTFRTNLVYLPQFAMHSTGYSTTIFLLTSSLKFDRTSRPWRKEVFYSHVSLWSHKHSFTAINLVLTLSRAILSASII